MWDERAWPTDRHVRLAGTGTVAGGPARAILERYVERGARGFGELKPGVRPDDSRLETLYELCVEYELPILCHVDDKSMLDEVSLPRLEDVLASFSEVDFIVHAHGWWAHISADVEETDFGRSPSGEEWADIRYRNFAGIVS